METEDEVVLISDTESVAGGGDKNKENKERSSKRKADEEGGQMKKIKGENDNLEKVCCIYLVLTNCFLFL